MTGTDTSTDAPPTAAAARSWRAGLARTRTAFSSLRDPRYRWWFAGQVLSSSGHVTQAAGLAWLVLSLSGRAVDLGLVTTAAMLPILVGAAPAGALVDRFDRRRLLLVTQVLLLSIGVLLAVLTATGVVEVWMVLVVAFVSGTVAAVDGPARQVFVLDLVGPERLASAVSLYEVVMNAARVIGPSVGGVLLALVGPAACFAFNASTYLLPLGVLVALRAGGTRQVRHAPGTPTVSFRAGMAYAFRHPVIRACLLLAAASTMIFNQGVLVPVLATDALGLPPQGFGALMAAFGLGALPGAIAAAGGGEAPSGRLVAALSFATGVAILPLGLAPGFAVALVAAAVLGFVSIWFVAAANTLVQLTSAPHLRGRVMGAWTAALPGSGLVTALALGAITDEWGVRAAYVALAAMFLLAAAVGAPALLARRPVDVTTP
ncbi:MFS transporter [Cellulomonas biazotea]|uniref:MFS transporter n=1 Tax=Cellulomonas biazotea TaxID=1709 RepID=A0A402DW57_9CELL|nr:MFS transporter [Cellulomonas biazotea]GCE78357.1 MFS transporter [Cellulomonas biazotea]